jgi:MarR family transcriptional regulator, transcriptional regulator for hemolysin
MALIPDDRAGRELGLAGGHELDAPPWSRVEGTLMSTARAVRRAYDRSFADLDVNLAEASVLAHLGDAGSLTQTELARRIGTGRAHIGVQVDSLQTKGAVERTGDPSDRRVWKVALTSRGRDLWAQTIEVDRRVRHQLRAGISSAERDQLDSLLERIHRNISELLDGEPSTARPTTVRRA